MEIKKSTQANVSSHTDIFLLIGVNISLLIILVGLEFSKTQKIYQSYTEEPFSINLEEAPLIVFEEQEPPTSEHINNTPQPDILVDIEETPVSQTILTQVSQNLSNYNALSNSVITSQTVTYPKKVTN